MNEFLSTNYFLSTPVFLSTQQQEKRTSILPKEQKMITSVFVITIHLSELGLADIYIFVYSWLFVYGSWGLLQGLNRKYTFCPGKHKISNHIFAMQKTVLDSISWLLRTSRSNTCTKAWFSGRFRSLTCRIGSTPLMLSFLKIDPPIHMQNPFYIRL